MNAAAKYHELALDCLNLAEAAHDPATQDQVLRLAERWARLADRPEGGADSRWADEYRASFAVFCPETGKFNYHAVGPRTPTQARLSACDGGNCN
jgi:hypothetical protein